MNILAIGAHPDDIEFGCGGTLLKYAKKNCSIYMLVLTEGEVGSDAQFRRKEQEASCGFLKVKRLFWGGFPDTKITVSRDLIQIIEGVMNQTNPDLILFNYSNDIHQDHRALAQAAISASRYIKNVLFYEVPTTQDFQPDVFADIGDVLEEKLELLKIHHSQVDKTRVPGLSIIESATSCANFRGFQGRVKYAEGFKSLRFMLQI
ncbi:MAG: PIG-L deacetylase family protein [Candidatus Omnitrophota bacterium]